MKYTFFHKQLQFARSFKTKLNEALREVGLFHSQWLVLFSLYQKGSASLVEISEYLNVEKPTITRTVKRLEEQSFLAVIPSEDKRERRVQLTEKGENVYLQGYEIVFRLEENILKDLPENELFLTEKVLEQLQEKVNKGGF